MSEIMQWLGTNQFDHPSLAPSDEVVAKNKFLLSMNKCQEWRPELSEVAQDGDLVAARVAKDTEIGQLYAGDIILCARFSAEMNVQRCFVPDLGLLKVLQVIRSI